MNAKWNPAVKAIALSRSGKVDCVGSGLMTVPAVSSLLLGIALFDRLGTLGLAVALAVILGLHALAETISLSRIIERLPPLRWVDRLGRLPNAAESH